MSAQALKFNRLSAIAMILGLAAVLVSIWIIFGYNSQEAATNSYAAVDEADTYQNYDYIRANINLTDCVDTQLERLRNLLHGNLREDFVIPVTADGELAKIPRVNFIIPPEGNRTYFLIGLEEEPSQACIDFVLKYTGILRENAYIAKAVLRRGY